MIAPQQGRIAVRWSHQGWTILQLRVPIKSELVDPRKLRNLLLRGARANVPSSSRSSRRAESFRAARTERALNPNNLDFTHVTSISLGFLVWTTIKPRTHSVDSRIHHDPEPQLNVYSPASRRISYTANISKLGIQSANIDDTQSTRASEHLSHHRITPLPNEPPLRPTHTIQRAPRPAPTPKIRGAFVGLNGRGREAP